MAKNWVTKEFESLSYLSLSGLKDVIKRADEAADAGMWRKFEVEMRYSDSYSDSQSPCLMGERLETDEEEKKREGTEAFYKKQAEDRERELFERLKEKYKGTTSA